MCAVTVCTNKNAMIHNVLYAHVLWLDLEKQVFDITVAAANDAVHGAMKVEL